MDVLIVFESQYGNTQRIAETIADILRAGNDVEIVRAIPDLPVNLGEVDLLVLGCPIIAWKPGMAMQYFVNKLTSSSVRGKNFVCFDTRVRGPKWIVGDACETIQAQLKSLGAIPLTPPEKFYVQGKQGPLERGEMEHAAAWAKTLAVQMGARGQG